MLHSSRVLLGHGAGRVKEKALSDLDKKSSEFALARVQKHVYAHFFLPSNVSLLFCCFVFLTHSFTRYALLA